MHIALVGAGGVGGLLGALLAQAGGPVTLIARGAQLGALRERGLMLKSPLGDVRLAHGDGFLATDDLGAVGQAEAVLLGVKTWQVKELAAQLHAALAPGAFVVPLQNGVEVAGQLAATLGASRVMGGLCHMLAWIEEPGVIGHAGKPPSVTIGELDRAPSSRGEALAATLRAARIEAQVSPDVQAAIWEKLLFVGPLGAVGGASRAQVGAVRALPETRALLERAMHEVWSVARRAGVAVSEGAVAAALARVDSLPPDATTSLHRDLVAGRRSELHELVGAVPRLAKSAWVPVPVHELLYALLLPQEHAARTR